MFEARRIPSIWKFGDVKFVPKSGKADKTHYKSFRPITLLSVLGKWFEKIILKRLQSLAFKNDWISEKQFGFVPGKSCEDALVSIVQKIERGFS